MMKRIGLRTDPCINPDVGVWDVERWSRYLTLKVRFVRYVFR